MRDWRAYVRGRIRLRGFAPEREAELIEEIAAQLEDVARHAIDDGASDEEACRIAERHIADWNALAADVARADKRRAMPIERRLAERLDADRAPAWRRLASDLAADLLYGVRV